MTQTLTAYLRVHLAGTPVLVPREAVQSVRGLSGSVLPLAGKTPRLQGKTGHSRLVVDAARLLGLGCVAGPDPTGLRMASADENAGWLCLVDRVERIEDHGATEVLSLPPALGALRRWLSGVIVDPASDTPVCVLRAEPVIPPFTLLRHLRAAAVDPSPLREELE
jgi:chemotaxis signal transduction protein